MQTLIRRAGVTVVAIVAGAFLFCIADAYAERRQAEQFLGLLERIRVGSTNRAAVMDETKPFRGHTSESKQGAVTELSFSFDNGWLRRLKLAPYTDFRGVITFEDEIVVSKRARVFEAASGCAATVTERKRGFGLGGGEVEPKEQPNHVVFAPPLNSPTSARRIIVIDDDSYGNAKNDWRFNLSCLTRFGGCKDARLMLPNAVPTQL